jgi:hypothetical protein
MKYRRLVIQYRYNAKYMVYGLGQIIVSVRQASCHAVEFSLFLVQLDNVKHRFH